ncbi:NEW3 domain-containing protein [Nonomuraea sp. M3C6]|uniref:NEW3 domain-containing protein n=1 Tax=Nonomuraea marmarensis TaxID=3351344 RepID=A0ABW7AUE6_9ACTN
MPNGNGAFHREPGAVAGLADAEALAGEPFNVQVTVAATGKAVPAGELALVLPNGWTSTPTGHKVLPLKPGESQTLAFQATPVAGKTEQQATIRAVLTGDDWRVVGLASTSIRRRSATQPHPARDRHGRTPVPALQCAGQVDQGTDQACPRCRPRATRWHRPHPCADHLAVDQ